MELKISFKCPNKITDNTYVYNDCFELKEADYHHIIADKNYEIKNFDNFEDNNLNKIEKNSSTVYVEDNLVLSNILNENPSTETQTELNINKKLNKKKSKKDSLPDHIKKIAGVDDNDIKFKCELCNRVFKSRNQKYYHLYCNDINKSPYKCNYCDKIFLSAYHLNYHKQIHENLDNYRCEKCNKIFSRSQTLQRHLKEHENLIKYNCSKCDSIYKNKIAYLGHVQKHDNIFVYTCHCNKNFTIKSNFKQHILIHTEEKDKFECNLCMKHFTRKSSYKAHLMRHKEQKDFQCSECSKTFIDKKTLDRHKKIHDDFSESVLYKCSVCDIKSKRKDNLIRHLRNMHSDVKTKTIVVIEKEISKLKNKNPADDYINSCEKIQSQESATISVVQSNNNMADQIVINSSVIRSIGNVEPVIIPNITSNNRDNLYHYNKKTAEIPMENNKINNEATTVPPKKRKKKYDPCEIYRKILLASNDEDSIAESEDITTEEHSSCCNETNNSENYINFNKKTPLSSSSEKCSEFLSNSNFAEIHWRKRTSQYFLNMFD